MKAIKFERTLLMRGLMFLGALSCVASAPAWGAPTNDFYFRGVPSNVANYDTIRASETVTGATQFGRSVTCTQGAADDLIYSFVQEVAVATTTLSSGAWTMNFYAAEGGGGAGRETVKVYVYTRDVSGTETLLFTSNYGPVIVRSNNNATHAVWGSTFTTVTSVNLTDRIVVKVYAAQGNTGTKTAGDVVTFYYDYTTRPSLITTPFDVTAPDPVSNLAGVSGAVGNVNLSWTAPGNDGRLKNLLAGSQFIIQYSTYAAAWNENNAQISIATSNVIPGSTQGYAVGGLVGGTSYYFVLWTEDESGNVSNVSNSTIAVAGQPAMPGLLVPAYTAVYASSVTAQWTAGGNPGGTVYNLQASTAPNFSGVVVTSSTLNSTATISGLNSLTTYYFQVDAVIGISSSSYLSLGSTITLPAPPVSISSTFTRVGVTSVTAQWGDAINPPGTRYNLQASTAANFTGMLISSNTANLSATLIGLSSHSLYYFEVWALGPGSFSSYVNLGSTKTLVAPPLLVTPAFTMVGVTSATVQWGSSGNGTGTSYNLLASTAPDFSGVVLTSATANSTATITGLSTSTVYFLQVDAVVAASSSAFLSLGSTVTLPSAPISISSTFTMVGISSVAAQWSGNGNGAAVSYFFNASTAANFTGTLFSISTAGSPGVITGLAGLTTYYFEVQAQTASGVSTFTALGSTTTLSNPALPPGTLSSTFTMVGASSVTAQWTPGGNPANTIYTLQASTAANFSGTLISSATGGAGTISATVSGLFGNTTYYLQVEATVNGGNAFTSLGSTITFPAPPVSISSTFTLVGMSSITAQWGSGTNSAATIYDLNASTASNFSGILQSSSTYNLSAVVSGLAINTAYYFEVRARGNGFASAYVSLGSTITYPAAPLSVASTFTAVNISSITAQWNADGNGGGVTYKLQASTASDFTGILFTASALNLSTAVTGLAGFTTYYFAVNATTNGYSSPFTGIGSTVTLPAPSGTVSSSFLLVGITSVTLQWDDGGNGPGISFLVQASTISNFTGTLKSSNTANAFATLTGLSTNTAYYFEVQSKGDGNSSSFTNIGSTQTLVPPPAVSTNTFANVAVSSITTQWGSGGNPPGTLYTLLVSDLPDFSNVVLTSATTNLSVTATNLSAATTYYFEVKTTLAGVDSVYTVLGSTLTLPPAPSLGNTFYFRQIAGDISGYDTLTATQAPTASVDSTRLVTTSAGNIDNLIYSYVGPAVGTGTLRGGTWTFNFYGSESNTNANATLKAIVYIRSGASESQYIASPYGQNLTTAKTLYTWNASASALAVNPTDRIVVKVYAAQATGLTKASGRTVTFYLDSTAANSSVGTPFDIVAPSTVANFNAATGGVGQVNLNWNAPGNDGPYGNLPAGAFFLIDFSTYAITWSTADSQVINLAISGISPGSAQNTTVSGLVGGTTYYFAMWTQDESGNVSGVSNTTSAVAGRPSAPGLLAPSIQSVFISSISAQWTNGGNPAGTIYNLQASTASDFSGTILSSSTSNTSAIVSGLAGGTTYFLEVDAVIGISSSVYFVLGSTRTLSPHATVTTTSIAPATANQGKNTALLKFVVQPAPEAANGLQWSSLRVQFTDQNLTALTNAQAGVLFSSVSIVADALGDATTGIYLFNVDTAVVANVNVLSLDGTGHQTLTVSTPVPSMALTPNGQSQIYYLAVKWTSNAAAQSPNTVRASLVVNSDVSLKDPVTNSVAVIDTAGTVTTSSTTAFAPAPPLAGWPMSLGTSSASVEGGFTFATNSNVEYAGTDDNKLIAMNSNGTIAWAFSTSYPVRTSPTDSLEGGIDYIYFADDGGNVYKVRDNGTSASQMWKRSLPGVAKIVTSPVMAGTTVYMAAPDGKVYSLNYLNGNDTAGWGYNTPGAVAFTATPFLDNFDPGINSIFLGAQGGLMYRINVVDGSVFTSFNGSADIYATANLESGQYNSANNSYVLYWGADDGVMRARTSANLASVPASWTDFTVNPTAAIRSSPFINRNESPYGLYFGCNNGKVYKLNAVTGAKVWEYQTNGPVYTTPIPLLAAWTGASADYVYFGSDDGNVYAVNAANGALKSNWPVNLGGPVRSGPVYDGGTNTITVGSLDGSVARIVAGP